jgi:hypothetical protein
VRERYEYTRWWSALLVEPVQLISFVMSRRMLRGIKHRSQRTLISTSKCHDQTDAKAAGALAGSADDPENVAVNLYWLPLGAGGHSVRFNGMLYEAAVAWLGHRPACDLYHSALEVRVPAGRFVIEQTPVPDDDGANRGVVAGGAVGSRWAGRLRIFRYELRRWRDGVIPDIAEAVESPQLLTTDPRLAQRVLDLAPSVPDLVWGRDQLATGEMWNSNSFISWLLERSGIDTEPIHLPIGGRAPGWQAGLISARRS